MCEPGEFDRPAGDRLMLQALLYAGGELDGADAEAFECRLADDQQAREALAHAVKLSLTLDRSLPAAPEPSYRERVRERLRGGRGLWGRLAAPRFYRGHPAAWA